MYLNLKSASIIVFSFIIYLFTNYLSIYHYLSEYYNGVFNDMKNGTVYDYIIVGAGSAGSVIASRLSNAGEKVLLLEAGGMPPFFADIPVLAPALQNSTYDWQYITEPQKQACKALNNQRSIWPMGKILGGSSRLNYMVYVNGHPHDYLSWFPDYIEPTVENGGSLHIQSVRWTSKIADVIIDGVREMSYPIHDINKIGQSGFMKINVTMKDGLRWSTDKVLNNAETLTVLTNALVHRVLFVGKRANGVEFMKFGAKYHAFAKKGVVLSAGAIGSPKLLMLSGIGPKDHLKEHKITVKADLPVGKNLVDHIVTAFDLVTLNISQPLNIFDLLNPKSVFNFLIYGQGPYSFGGVEVTGTFYKSSITNESSSPDLQIMTLPGGISQDIGVIIRKTFGISDKIYEEYFASLENKTAVTISPVLLHPKSTGYIQLRSTNPEDPPIIDPKYLTVKDDVDTLIAGLQFIKKLVKTKAMQNIGAEIYNKPFPGCEHLEYDSYDYWECYVRHLTLTSYHPAGTCKMDEVVDKTFKVHDVNNLYVVDASVFPILPSGNINAGVVMLAEKFAQLVLQKSKIQKHTHHKCYLIDIFVQS